MNLTKNRKVQTLFTAALALIIICGTGTGAAAAEKKMLVPMGKTVGIQMFTKGVLVVGILPKEEGTVPSAAAEAGLLPGDLITALGDKTIDNADDFRAAMETLKPGEVSVAVTRAMEKLQLTMNPRFTDGVPELGVWLRDRIAGIGTLTYYDPETGAYGGLGHAINDVDTGLLIPLGHGQISNSSVSDVKKGCPGAPGELCGAPNPNSICGSIAGNTESGIFGALNSDRPDPSKAIPAATDGEIHLGPATIYANISGTEIKEYEIEVTRVYRGDDFGRSMMLRVTDPELLTLTGGIVQGMSGSPIIQEGKLIGAVTHVLINDPEKGFGVSVERMLKAGDDCLSAATSEKAA